MELAYIIIHNLMPTWQSWCVSVSVFGRPRVRLVMSAVLVPAGLPRDTLLLPPEKWREIRSHLTLPEQQHQRRQEQEQEQEQRRRAASALLRRDWPESKVRSDVPSYLLLW